MHFVAVGPQIGEAQLGPTARREIVIAAEMRRAVKSWLNTVSRANMSAELGAVGLDSMRPLLDSLHGPFYLKDRDHRFVCVNTAMAELCRVRSPDDVVSRRASEFFPPEVSERLDAAEQRAWENRRAVTDQLLAVPLSGGGSAWIMFGCWPMLTEGGLNGMAGLGRIVDTGDRKNKACERVSEAAALIAAGIAARVRVQDLADRLSVSVSQIERDFLDVFGAPPTRYVARVRLETAMDLLRGGESIAAIALACGYSDQSAFTRRFQAAAGVTPSEYRRRCLREVTL